MRSIAALAGIPPLPCTMSLGWAAATGWLKDWDVGMRVANRLFKYPANVPSFWSPASNVAADPPPRTRSVVRLIRSVLVMKPFSALPSLAASAPVTELRCAMTPARSLRLAPSCCEAMPRLIRIELNSEFRVTSSCVGIWLCTDRSARSGMSCCTVPS